MDTFGTWVPTLILLVVGVVAALGYFRKERAGASAAALETAESEINILKSKVSRLEEEAAIGREQSAKDQARIQMLTELVSTGGYLSEQIQALVHTEISVVVRAIDDGKRDLLIAIEAIGDTR